MKNEYKIRISEWCQLCTAATAPNQRCRDCHVLDAKEEGGKAMIGQPSEFIARSEEN